MHPLDSASNEAMVWNDRVFSWSLLDEYVHSTSRRLKEIGVKYGARVLVEAVPSAGTVIVLLSLWHIGAVACPFDPRLPEGLAQAIRRKVAPFLLLTASSSDKRFPGLRTFMTDDVICLEPVERFMAGSSGSNGLSDGREATVLFTSGSSGDPKAVLHTFKAHWMNAKGAGQVIPFAAGDRWLMALPLHRISGIAVIFRALYGRGAMVLPGKNFPDIADAILKYKPTHISLVSSQFLRLLEVLPQEAWKPLKAVLIGGAPVPERLMERAAQYSLPVFLTYGMTETGSQIATSPLNEARECGGARVIPFREVNLINGEICVRGDILFKGYIDGDDTEIPLDENGWFHTGDEGTFAPPFLTVTGRRDRMFISGGENVFPEVIEKALLSLDQVVSARVEPKDDPLFGRVSKAYIRLKQGVAFDDTQFKRLLKERLFPFQVPKEFIVDPDYPFPEK